jgi:glycosyltransferase involved in cell wall biosynthesis
VTRAHEIPDDAFVIGLLARFDPWKGIDFALRALAPLLRHRDGLRLLIVGGPYRHFYPEYGAVLRSIAGEEGVLDRVIFAGFQLDVRPYYARLDALLHASVQPEPFGLTIVEGMAAEVPVIAADAGGPREIINSGVDGLLYRPADEAALREAVLRLLDDGAFRTGLATAGAATVSSRYRATALMSRLDAVYRQLCEPA